MNPDELGLRLIFVAVLLGLAAYFGWRQVQTLRKLASQEVGDAEDRRYLRTQAYRRLFCSGLMVVFAGLLVGWIFLDERYREIHAQAQQAQPGAGDGSGTTLTEEQKDFVRLFSVYWIVALLILLVLVALAAVDFWAIARYGWSQHRRLQADHRALLAEQVARRKQERNGQH